MKARVLKGGPGSGHHGHAGIPGHRGGSLPGSGSGGALDYVLGLSDEQQHEIERYTDDGYVKINQALRDAQGYPLTNEPLQKAVAQIDSVIADAPPLEHETLYRVMRGSADDNSIDYFTLQDSAFVSTTYSEKSLNDIMDNMDNPSGTFTVFKIYPDLQAKQPGLGAYIENASTLPHEKEVLLRRDSVFDVMDIYQEGNIWYVEVDLIDE